jgi:hypothetical protein
MHAASRKRTALKNEIEEYWTKKGRVVVLTGRRQDCELIARACAKRWGAEVPDELPHTITTEHGPIYWGHGGVSPAERDALGQAFAAHQGGALFIGTIDAYGEGVDYFKSCDLLLMAMLPYTPGQVEQAEYRVSRLGSDRPTLILYLVAQGTYDENVANILLHKLPVVEQVVGSSSAKELSIKLEGDEKQNQQDLIALLLAPLEAQEEADAGAGGGEAGAGGAHPANGEA